ncbi:MULTISPECIES: hypothetical protein [unclassified Endozoicomonas]|uniref:hypothetical protein n=1 Tax=unclassified Endozoicomonas TaxID=2644528 RepID=UPI003BB4C48C
MHSNCPLSQKYTIPFGQLLNDLHIVGHCRSEGLVLVTNNTRGVKRVDGLRIENWVEDSLS